MDYVKKRTPGNAGVQGSTVNGLRLGCRLGKRIAIGIPYAYTVYVFNFNKDLQLCDVVMDHLSIRIRSQCSAGTDTELGIRLSIRITGGNNRGCRMLIWNKLIWNKME